MTGSTEEILDAIRQQEDYLEEKFYYGEDKFFMINYIDESSVILGNKVRMTFLYEWPDGEGRGIQLELIY